MAADQRKRRLSAAPALGCGGTEQYRAKKRDLRSPQHDFNFNSHISLKWDDNGKRVVAKEDQVSISWRHLRSFVPAASCSNSKLADVVTVPREVFQLDDLSGVLSYEVWESLLTEKERSYLLQLLPQGLDTDQVVQDLFGGDNFHFGNPFLKWGAKLCSGDLHPDAIVHHEKSFKTSKKEYYSELQQYHEEMIRNLQKLKERCAKSKDPEAEILQIVSRSKRHAERSILPNTNGMRPLKPEDNVAVMSESLLPLPDEKLYYSDNQKLSTIRDAEIQKRIRNEEVTKDKQERLVASANSMKVSPKLKKAEKLQKSPISSNDGAKYMSYVKISKKQHELVKSMKQSGSSIQSKTLNRVLGNLNSFNVKPYEMFVEEEQKRIHEYWSNLANNDIPAALQNWRTMQSERNQVLISLLHEIEEKVPLIMKDEMLDNYALHSETQDEKSDDYGFHVQDQDEDLTNPNDEETMGPEDTVESSQGTSEPQQDDASASQYSISDNNEAESDPSSPKDDSMQNPPFSVNEEFDPSPPQNQCLVENAPANADEEIQISSMENQSSMHNPTLNVNEEFNPMENPMDLNAENNNVIMETSEANSLDVSQHPQSHTSLGVTNSEGMPCSSVKNVWTSVGLPESYRHAPPTTQYASCSDPPPLRHPQFVPNQPASLIDLESNLREEDTTKDLLKRHSDHMPYFNPYQNRDRNELLQSLIKRDNYQQEQKKTGLQFHPASSVLLEPAPFHNNFREQIQPSFSLDGRPKVQSELFMNQNIQDSIYSDNRFPIQAQEHFATPNVRDWTNTRLSAPIQPSQLGSGEPFSHHWFGGENRAHGGWPAPDSSVFSSPSLGSGSTGDQSLYSVLTQCNTLHSRAPFNPVASTEQQMIAPTNYGQDMTGEIPMPSNTTLPQTASPFDYLGGNEAAAVANLKPPNMGWMSLGHQAPGLQDPSGRPFFKSWHQ